MKWWLISDETLNTINDKIAYLNSNRLPRNSEEKLIVIRNSLKKIQYELDSGTHTTDCIPTEYQETRDKRDEAV